MTRAPSVLLVTVLLASLAAADEAEPAPVVRDGVALRFPGARTMSWASLADVVASDVRLYRRSGYDPLYADDAADALIRFYLSQGYTRADVDAVPPEDGAWTAALTFRIREHRRRLLGEIGFEGNEHVASEVLLRFVRRGEGLFGAPVLVDERLEADLRSIEAYYAQQGWLSARAGPPRTTGRDATDDRIVLDLVIPVGEGPRTWLRFEDVSLSGARLVGEDTLRRAVAATLAPASTSEDRVPYERMIPFLVENAIRETCGARGLPFARVEVTPSISEDGTAARLSVRIEEGKKARVVAIDVEGNVEVPTFAILREMGYDSDVPDQKGGTIDVGMEYDVRRVRNAQLALFRTGLFTSVRIDPRPVEGEPRQVILAVRVREKDHRSLDLRVGWGSYDRLRLGASLGDEAWHGVADLLGTEWNLRALRGRLRADVSQKSALLGAQLRDLRFLQSRIESVLEVSLEERQNVSYSFRRAALRLGFLRRLPEINSSLAAEAAYSFSLNDILSAEGEIDPAIRDAVNVGSVSVGLLGDWRDDRIWPTRRGFFAARYELADPTLGGEIAFHRATLDAGYHLPLEEEREWVLSFGARLGVIVPRGGTKEIPIQERFFSGGGSSVRSFQEQMLGPRRDGTPLGGESTLTGNVELLFPIRRPLYGAVFGDAGNVRPQASQALDLEKMGYGLGGGIRVRTPVGPLRLDAAWNPSPRPGDPTWRFLFSVGFVF